jgi:hypothetical protein
MLRPITTAGLIDEFESRFTTASGAHFLIARAGDEAWPISEQESLAFRERYRSRMLRARFLRRASLMLFPALLVLGWQLPREPEWLIELFEALTSLALFVGPIFGFSQHSITSDITKASIERQLERRITTRHDPAITPTATPLARMVRKMLILVGVVLSLIEVGHLIGPREELGGHIRVLTGLTAGNESQLARFTGTLAFLLYWTVLIGSTLLWVDRRKRQRAATASWLQVDKTSINQCDAEDSESTTEIREHWVCVDNSAKP